MESKEKKKDVIGRTNGVNPTEGERYFLRLLLNHVRGPTSFEDLLTVQGTRYSTFKESAQKRGLLESDNSILECLEEAVTFQVPHALRRLFATILVYCEPTDVRNLWDTYFDAMSEDFKKGEENSINGKISSTLKSLNSFLDSMGKCINCYDLPILPPDDLDDVDHYSREVRDEMAIDIPTDDLSAEFNLNTEQYSAFSIILDRVQNEASAVFFIDGPGGIGKTYLYRALLAHLRSKNKIALTTATSGVATTIMPSGRTAHSRFKIPIIANETTMCNIPKQSGPQIYYERHD